MCFWVNFTINTNKVKGQGHTPTHLLDDNEKFWIHPYIHHEKSHIFQLQPWCIHCMLGQNDMRNDHQ